MCTKRPKGPKEQIKKNTIANRMGRLESDDLQIDREKKRGEKLSHF